MNKHGGVQLLFDCTKIKDKSKSPPLKETVNAGMIFCGVL
jgi:hypothetical protein